MSDNILEELAASIEMVGVDEVLEHIATVCRDTAEEYEEKDEETSRKWRVRGNGVMQALRFYQAFIKERNAG